MRQVYYFNEDPKPRDYIDNLPDAEAAKMDLQLELMCETPPHEWRWVKPVDGKLWEIKSKSHRLFYCLQDGDIIIVHAVRKRGRKLKRKDIEKAKKRQEYLTIMKEKRKDQE